MRKSIISAVLVLPLISASAGAGEVIDVRDCPLDTVTFIDPWAEGEFAVTRVGTSYEYSCESGYAEQPIAGEECRGPFGDLVLEGRLREYEGSPAQMAFAIWTVIEGSPCCGWSVMDEASGQSLTQQQNFTWLDDDSIPILRDLRFADISFRDYAEGQSLFGNPKVAMKCELD
jgi:hypothetical protein